MVDPGGGPFLVTAHHVYEEFCAARAARVDTVCVLNDLTKFPLDQRLKSRRTIVCTLTNILICQLTVCCMLRGAAFGFVRVVHRMIESIALKKNHLLAALSPEVLARLSQDLEIVTLQLGASVYESGDAMSHVYFPTDSIVSLLYVMENGASAEISVVGNEGLVGVALYLGGESTPSRAVVQSAGSAFRLPRPRLIKEFNRHGELLTVMLRYTQCLLTQMAQTAVCNRHHTVDQQLCRWLLLSLDRLPTNNLTMTQELIANMLGVRREGVTEAAGKLQKLGVIRYLRGKITVLDRPKLETLSCECYGVVKTETDRLMPYYWPALLRKTSTAASA